MGCTLDRLPWSCCDGVTHSLFVPRMIWVIQSDILMCTGCFERMLFSENLFSVTTKLLLLCIVSFHFKQWKCLAKLITLTKYNLVSVFSLPYLSINAYKRPIIDLYIVHLTYSPLVTRPVFFFIFLTRLQELNLSFLWCVIKSLHPLNMSKKKYLGIVINPPKKCGKNLWNRFSIHAPLSQHWLLLFFFFPKKPQ